MISVSRCESKRWHSVYAGLGSNCGEARELLNRACELIAAVPGTRFCARSPIYMTEPQGYREQPWFLNCVVHLEVMDGMEPYSLLQAFLAIEAGLGRTRVAGASRFGPRCIDIDLLLFGDRRSDNPDCILPHPRMHERAFVLLPLHDIAPDLLLYGEPLAAHLSRIPWRREGEKIYQTEP